MKLYEVPLNSLVRVLETPEIPPDSQEVTKGEVIKYYHIDGMYGICKNQENVMVYIKAWTEVEILNEV